MTISNQIKSDLSNILKDVGTTIDAFLNPTYTLNSEQEISSISKGTKTATSAFFYSDDGEEFIPEVEGIDRRKRFRVFLPHSVGTITSKSLFRIPATSGDFYSVVTIDTNPISGTDIVFYDILIERFQSQQIIS
jgi:hypothetical protein